MKGLVITPISQLLEPAIHSCFYLKSKTSPLGFRLSQNMTNCEKLILCSEHSHLLILANVCHPFMVCQTLCKDFACWSHFDLSSALSSITSGAPLTDVSPKDAGAQRHCVSGSKWQCEGGAGPVLKLRCVWSLSYTVPVKVFQNFVYFVHSALQMIRHKDDFKRKIRGHWFYLKHFS